MSLVQACAAGSLPAASQAATWQQNAAAWADRLGQQYSAYRDIVQPIQVGSSSTSAAGWLRNWGMWSLEYVGVLVIGHSEVVQELVSPAVTYLYQSAAFYRCC